MTRYIALLRAINVGGHTVKMDRLRALFEAMGLANVETFIASGNVIFETAARKPDALEAKIEAHLARELGYEVGTFLRTPAEIAAVAAARPFGEPDPVEAGQRLYVLFFKEPLGDAVARRAAAIETPVDRLRVLGRELYWRCTTSTTESLITPAMWSQALGKLPATNRNVTTVRKLSAKYPA